MHKDLSDELEAMITPTDESVDVASVTVSVGFVRQVIAALREGMDTE